MDPWLVDLIVVRTDLGRGLERRSLARDVERGLLVRVRPGVYVPLEAWTAVGPAGRSVLRIRALAATSSRPPVFSHWSAAAIHGLTVMAAAGDQVHVTVTDRAHRGASGASAHLLALRDEEIVAFRGLLVTRIARTVVDLAGTSPFPDGVVAAYGVLAAGSPTAGGSGSARSARSTDG